MGDSVRKTNFSPFLRQAFVTFGVVINVVGHGCVLGFAAVLLPQLQSPDSYIKADPEGASWIASIVGFTLVAGNLITPYLMEKYGRKMTHILTTLPITVGWFLILIARSVSLIILGRFLQGLSLGMHAALGPIIIGESVSPTNRGFFLGGMSLALSTGVLLSHIFGTLLSWQWTALVCVAFSFFAFVIIMFSPESPSWLATQQKYDECRKSFHWLRGYDEQETIELETMLQSIYSDSNQDKLNLKQKDTSILNNIGKKEFYKPIIIMIHCYMMFQFSGNNVLCAYAIDILEALFEDNVNVYLIMILLDCLRLATSVISCNMVKRLKRKTVLKISGFVSISSLIAMAVYVYLKSRGIVEPLGFWFPSTLIAIYIFSLAIGVLPVPFTIAGEIFPVAYRSMGGGISVLFLSLNYFAAVKSAPFMFISIGVHGTFVCYAIILLYCLIVIQVLLPETKDRSLIEIENYFKGIKFTRVSQNDKDCVEKVSPSYENHNETRLLSS